MGTDTEYEGDINYAGEPIVRARDWDGSCVMWLRQAQAQYHALGEAIAEAQSKARRFENQVASAENEEAAQ